MGASSQGLHEDPSTLSPEAVDRHRAIVSIMEELEAIDWYDQRVAAATDPELARVLAHNRDEEKEHAAMVLEWLRRHDAALDEHMKTYLFRDGPITEREEAAETSDADDAASSSAEGTATTSADGSLGLGSLKGARGAR